MYQQPFSTTPQWEIANGMSVFATDGTKLGTIQNYTSGDTSLDVQKGWLFHKDVYVPIDVVSHVDADGVTLSLDKAALEEGRFEQPVRQTDSLFPAQTTGDEEQEAVAAGTPSGINVHTS